MWCKLNCLQCSLLARCLPTRNSFNQKKCCMPTVNKEEYWVLWIGNESLLDMCKLTEHYTLNTANKGRYAQQSGVSRLCVWTGGFHHLFNCFGIVKMFGQQSLEENIQNGFKACRLPVLSLTFTFPKWILSQRIRGIQVFHFVKATYQLNVYHENPQHGYLFSICNKQNND